MVERNKNSMGRADTEEGTVPERNLRESPETFQEGTHAGKRNWGRDDKKYSRESVNRKVKPGAKEVVFEGEVTGVGKSTSRPTEKGPCMAHYCKNSRAAENR